MTIRNKYWQPYAWNTRCELMVGMPREFSGWDIGIDRWDTNWNKSLVQNRCTQTEKLSYVTSLLALSVRLEGLPELQGAFRFGHETSKIPHLRDWSRSEWIDNFCLCVLWSHCGETIDGGNDAPRRFIIIGSRISLSNDTHINKKKPDRCQEIRAQMAAALQADIKSHIEKKTALRHDDPTLDVQAGEVAPRVIRERDIDKDHCDARRTPSTN